MSGSESLFLFTDEEPWFSSSSSISSLENIRNKFQYLKETRDFINIIFSNDICSLIFEYLSENEIFELFSYIAEGEQDKAEAVISVYPGLLLKKGKIKDLAGRGFENITVFQYAVWALDWHMWKMLLRHMPKETAALQYKDLEEKGTVHGLFFSLEPLIRALNEYADNCLSWNEFKGEQHWCEEIRRSQLLLPSHIVSEYCHPNRALYPCPKFDEDEEELLRNRNFIEGDWYVSEYQCETDAWEVSGYTGNTGVGKKFAIVRSGFEEARAISSLELQEWIGNLTDESPQLWVTHDAQALQNLWETRQSQLKALKLHLFTTPKQPSENSLIGKNLEQPLTPLQVLIAKKNVLMKRIKELEKNICSEKVKLSLIEKELLPGNDCEDETLSANKRNFHSLSPSSPLSFKKQKQDDPVYSPSSCSRSLSLSHPFL